MAKNELIDHVWDSAADVTPNTVEVYAGYLRRKLGADRLVTVRGVGYRLVHVKRFWTLSLRARLMIIGRDRGRRRAGHRRAGVLRRADPVASTAPWTTRRWPAPRMSRRWSNEDRLPNPVPVSGAQVIQVVDAEQRVVGGSATADRLTPLLRPDELHQALAGEALVVAGVRLGLGEPLRVRAVPAGVRPEPVSVIAAVPFGDVLATRTALRNALADHLPAAARRCSAAIAWRVIGWTLRPVEAAAGRCRADQRAAGRGATAPREDGCRCRRRPTRSAPWPSP